MQELVFVINARTRVGKVIVVNPEMIINIRG